jgi:hypothetical protein
MERTTFTFADLNFRPVLTASFYIPLSQKHGVDLKLITNLFFSDLHFFNNEAALKNAQRHR